MPEYAFTLILDGPVNDHIDELFEAGCDDATFGVSNGVPFGDFDREAPTFAEAVRSAIAAVAGVEELRVVRLEPDDLVTAAEIAERLGRTRESVRLLVSGQRGAGDFPAPMSHLQKRNRLWRWSEVAAWADPADVEAIATARLVAAINAKLALRGLEPNLKPADRDALASV